MRDWLKMIRMPPDTYARHAAVALLAGQDADRILDVGGIKGDLAAFLPEVKITTINMEGENADAIFDGNLLPFANATFDVVASLDVLEHIPKDGRAQHMSELVRTARRKVVLCCPLGTPEHVEAEKAVCNWHTQFTGEEHRFLSEHLLNGLPTQAELEDLASSTSRPYRIRYQGDFRRANSAFVSSVRLRHQPSPRRVATYLRYRLDPNRESELEESSSRFTNRAFVEIEARG